MAVNADGGLEVGVSTTAGPWGRILTRDWHVDEDDVPALLHRLNLCQSALWRNAEGQAIRLRVEPKARTVRCEEQTDGAEAP
jgi:hypothetical protein